MKLCGNFIGTASNGSPADFMYAFKYNHNCGQGLRAMHKNGLLYYIMALIEAKYNICNRKCDTAFPLAHTFALGSEVNNYIFFIT